MDDEDDERAPQPGLAGVPRLIEDVSRAGLAASLNVEGRPRPLPQGVELSAYRIVQEGLTNSLKHVHAHRVDVRLAYVDHALEVEIRDDGAGRATAGDLGYGLVGVRERVKLYGGEMSAGVDTGGGFVLRTRLPFDEGRSR